MGIINIKKKLMSMSGLNNNKKIETEEGKQDLGMYWDPKFGEILETWGEKHVWNEIQMFLSALEGNVLDIACGTGITTVKLRNYPKINVYGCDISDFLINKAIEKGIPTERLEVCDATKMDIYKDDFFDYSFSIGSLEHFTNEGIDRFISEAHRVTNKVSFHMMPVSKSGKNEGWMKTKQSFYNNSVSWWVDKFSNKFELVRVINSGWEDKNSDGKWFVCYKKSSND